MFPPAVLLSAFLLFAVEPMLGKKVLPLLGGAPEVWNTCMVFFQSALLAGYGFAHALARWAPKKQAAAYLAALALGALVLPMRFAAAPPGPDASPAVWLLVRLTTAAGLPFFALAAASPLLQRWYSASEGGGEDPFFLYSASNIGSLAALLAYPAIIEPRWPVDRQAALWAWGYGGFVVLAGGCAWLVSKKEVPTLAHPRSAGVGGWRESLKWLAMALVPSSLMLGVTTHITTNIAPMPLLWVLPLAVYLLSFILAFARRRPFSTDTIARVVPFVLLPLALLSFMELKGLRWLLVPAHLTVLFVSACLCHFRLADSRPDASRLTAFYLWTSLGGALGGVFNALAAPALFKTVAEYPLALVAVACLMPPLDRRKDLATRLLDMSLPFLLGLFGLWAVLLFRRFRVPEGSPWAALAFGLMAVAVLSFRPRPLRFGFGFAMLVWTYGAYAALQTGKVLHLERDFYGVKRILYDARTDMNVFVHGGTFHGMQSRDPAKKGEPFSYFSRQGPIGEFMDAWGARSNRFAVVGLGIGSLAAYRAPGRTIAFYELDPAIERLARDTRWFTYLADCGGACTVTLGDGRLRLAQAPEQAYDLIILDVFGSEAMPAHFLTRQAFELYDKKLAPHGMLLFNISSRYLELEPLLSALAKDRGWSALARLDLVPPAVEESTGRLSSHWVVVSRDKFDLAVLASKGWRPPLANGMKPWTDDSTSLLPLVRWL